MKCMIFVFKSWWKCYSIKGFLRLSHWWTHSQGVSEAVDPIFVMCSASRFHRWGCAHHFSNHMRRALLALLHAFFWTRKNRKRSFALNKHLFYTPQNVNLFEYFFALILKYSHSFKKVCTKFHFCWEFLLGFMFHFLHKTTKMGSAQFVRLGKNVSKGSWAEFNYEKFLNFAITKSGRCFAKINWHPSIKNLIPLPTRSFNFRTGRKVFVSLNLSYHITTGENRRRNPLMYSGFQEQVWNSPLHMASTVK